MRKILALFVGVAMLLGLLPVMVEASGAIGPNADGYFLLEHTDATDCNYILGSTANERTGKTTCTGNSALSLNGRTSAHGIDSIYLEFTVNIERGAGYNIYTHATPAYSNEAWSPSSVTIDSTEVAMTGDSSTKINFEGSYPMAWNYGFVWLTPGEHTVRYTLTDPRTQAENNGILDRYYGSFDCIVIKQHSYVWTYGITSGALTNTPEKPSYHTFDYGFAWLENIDSDVARMAWRSDNGTTQTDAIFSGGSARRLLRNTADYTAEHPGYFMEYCVNVPETGTYTIWIYGTNNSNTNCSTARVGIGGAVYTPVHSSRSDSQGNVNYAWCYATVNLQEGENDLCYFVDNMRNAGDYYVGGLDCICIVPSSYSWNPTENGANATKPVIPITNAWLEAEYQDCSNAGGIISYSVLSGGKGAGRRNTDAHANGVEDYIDFNICTAAGTYDIYLRGTDDAFSADYMSNAIVRVDGTDTAYDTIISESWIDSKYAPGWTMIQDLSLTSGNHTLRWAVQDMCSKAGSERYTLLLDCVVIVPDGTQFVQFVDDIAKTKADYLLGDSKTNDSGVKVQTFALSKNLASGKDFQALADVKKESGSSKKANLMIALYDASGNLIKFACDSATLSGETKRLKATIAKLDASIYDETASARVFLWNDIDKLQVLHKGIALTK